MTFLSCPPVYHLPGTWTECKKPLINHLNLEPSTGYMVFFGLLFILLVAYGITNLKKAK